MLVELYPTKLKTAAANLAANKPAPLLTRKIAAKGIRVNIRMPDITVVENAGTPLVIVQLA